MGACVSDSKPHYSKGAVKYLYLLKEILDINTPTLTTCSVDLLILHSRTSFSKSTSNLLVTRTSHIFWYMLSSQYKLMFSSWLRWRNAQTIYLKKLKWVFYLWLQVGWLDDSAKISSWLLLVIFTLISANFACLAMTALSMRMRAASFTQLKLN